MNRELNRGFNAEKHPHIASVSSADAPPRSCSAETTLLIADDDALSRFLMLRLLQKHLPEARILQAASGSDTLQIWQQHRPRIILMDLEMPGMNGLDIAAAIRAAETDAGAAAADRPSAAPPSRIIVVSGSCCSDIQDEMRQHGIHAVLEKPVEPAALLSTVHTCLADSTL